MQCKDLLQRLICQKQDRLGGSVSHDADEIKSHAFFQVFNKFPASPLVPLFLGLCCLPLSSSFCYVS